MAVAFFIDADSAIAGPGMLAAVSKPGYRPRAPGECEMDDLANDPGEMVTIAGPTRTMTGAEQAEFDRFRTALARCETKRPRPLRAASWAPARDARATARLSGTAS